MNLRSNTVQALFQRRCGCHNMSDEAQEMGRCMMEPRLLLQRPQTAAHLQAALATRQQQELQAVGGGAEGALLPEQLCPQWRLVEAGVKGLSSFQITPTMLAQPGFDSVEAGLYYA